MSRFYITVTADLFSRLAGIDWCHGYVGYDEPAELKNEISGE